jgi:hypothetical protein
MKKNIFLTIILIILFTFGIFIYDFSDEMDILITNHSWYLTENNNTYELSFNNNKLTYLDEETEVSEYQQCENYHYNRNVNVIKLKCKGTTKKIYISSYDNDKLTLTIDGAEKTFYATSELAQIENFKQENNLTDSQYDELLSINFNESLFISYQEFKKLTKEKTKFYLGLVQNNIDFTNVYNYQVLNNLINNSSKDFYLINLDSLSESELNKLKKLIDIEDSESTINIYQVNNGKIKLKVAIDALNSDDINTYQNI